MIVIKLQEGLGNQLFQYFFGKSLKSDNIYFDTSFFSFNSSRQLDLNNFENISLRYLDANSIDINSFLYFRDNFKFDIPNIEQNQNYYFDGYWHSSKHLLPIKDKILEELSANQRLENYAKSKYPEMYEEEFISLHIRRNDYLKLTNYYYSLDKEYYDKAIDIIGANNKKIAIFSDDIDWCKANVHYKNCVFINQSPRVDLYLMSLCKYHIIANSTFSFWGAFSSKSTKKVVAPIKWYKENYSLAISENTEKDCAKHLILDDWIRI